MPEVLDISEGLEIYEILEISEIIEISANQLNQLIGYNKIHTPIFSVTTLTKLSCI